MIRRQKQSVISGMPWLAFHNPEIYWRIGKVKMTRWIKECGKQQRLKQGKLEWQKQKDKKIKEEEEKKQEENEQRIKEAKEKRKPRMMKVKKVAEEWEIWDKKVFVATTSQDDQQTTKTNSRVKYLMRIIRELDKKSPMHFFTIYTKESWSVLAINNSTLKYICCL